MSGNEDLSDFRSNWQAYPYFTDAEFNSVEEEEEDFVKKMHLSCRKRYETRIANYSLDHLDDGRNLDMDLNIVLLGKTGSGKSSTANTILGRKEFKVSSSSHSVTKVLLDNECTYKNRKITVVDTPGVHDTESDNATVKEELARIAFMLKDGVSCFIICMNLSETRFTKDLKEMLELIKIDGQGNFFDYCMLAYTRAETELEKCTLRKFLDGKKENKDNCRFLEKINDRVVAVNNKCLVPAEALRNRDALIEMANVVVAENRHKGNPDIYTVSLFKAAGALHEKVTSVVQRNNFHQGLIKAVIEVIITCHTSNPREFVESVISILRQPGFCGDISQIARYVYQIYQIYDEIQSEVNMFKKILAATTVTALGTGLSIAAGVGFLTTTVVASTFGIMSYILPF